MVECRKWTPFRHLPLFEIKDGEKRRRNKRRRKKNGEIKDGEKDGETKDGGKKTAKIKTAEYKDGDEKTAPSFSFRPSFISDVGYFGLRTS